jgi:RNase H-like domain found in reverse transcriptase
MRPAGFHSRKFTPAQVNYATHKQEILAIIETLMKYEDKLLGRNFVVVTDHRSLEFFKTQRELSRQQVGWSEYLGQYDF